MSTEQKTPTVNFNFTLDETNLIINALAELPAKMSMTLINKVTTVAQQQLQSDTPTSPGAEPIAL